MVFRPQKTEDRGMGFWSRSSTVLNFPSKLPLWKKSEREPHLISPTAHHPCTPISTTPFSFSFWTPFRIQMCITLCLCLSTALNVSVPLHLSPCTVGQFCPTSVSLVLVSVYLTQNSFLREQRCQLYFTRWSLLVNNNKKCAKGAVGGRDLVSLTGSLGFPVWSVAALLSSCPFPCHHITLYFHLAHTPPTTLRRAEGTCWSLPSPKGTTS